MIALKTITTIELSSSCNLACKYCVNRLLATDSRRRPGIMAAATFAAALAWLQKLCAAGSQREVNLNGNGESTLDPDLPARVRAVKDIVGAARVVALSTNGVAMTAPLAKALKDAGLDRIDLSLHSPRHARRAIYHLCDAGLPGTVTTGHVTAAHNWAGQLEAENAIDCRLNILCHPLIEGRGYVQSEGGVTPCCYDYRSFGVFGTVFDADLDRKPIRPYALCDACHQQIPQQVREAAWDR